MRRTRWLIGAAIVGLGTLVGYFGGLYWVQKYESTGVLGIELDLGTYKRIYERLSNTQTMRDYFQNQTGTHAGQLLLKRAVGRDPLKKMLSPIYTTTRNDIRDLGEIKTSSETPGSVILGLRLTVATDQPDLSQKAVGLLSGYIRDIALHSELTQWLVAHTTSVANQSLRNEAEQIKNQYEIEQAKQKITELREILAHTQKSEIVDARQIVSLSNGTERFLSPATQVIAEESRIVDLNNKARLLLRQQRQLKAQQIVFSELSEQSFQASNAQQMAAQITQALSTALNSIADQDSAVREIQITHQADIDSIKTQWTDKADFISGPTLPIAPSGLNSKHTAILAAMFSLFLAFVILYWSTFKRILTPVFDAFGLDTPQPVQSNETR